VVAIKRSIFWDITPCSPLKVNRQHGVISHTTEPTILFSYYDGQKYKNIGEKMKTKTRERAHLAQNSIPKTVM
jgi:hypothetical protein